ncbi:AAA family ATPase [Thomasclavelia sp.]|uniref:cytidylate kinase-like family protein n=1 Tax=Thomasclavelia sp. TaxID=3025757 RepID=UPI0025DCB889|nr:cytidylate kinase-like family protein [Thomasclavelia sp.]
MKCNVITIGHDYGSGGRDIGAKLAEKLGYKYYDTQITAKMAKESGLAESYIKENSEYATHSNYFLFTLNNWNSTGPSLMDQLYFLQREIILDLATKEKCVIVGHCSDYALRNVANCFHVYLQSNIETRAKRVVEKYHEEIEDPVKELKNRDSKRKTYYRYYTDRKLNDLANYDLVIDRTHLSDDDCVEIIYEALKRIK